MVGYFYSIVTCVSEPTDLTVNFSSFLTGLKGTQVQGLAQRSLMFCQARGQNPSNVMINL